MKKRNKKYTKSIGIKGGLDWEKLIDGAIHIAILILIIVGAVFLIIKPLLAKFGGTASNVISDGLDKINIFGDDKNVEEQKKPDEKPKTCDDKYKALKAITDKDKKKEMEETIFDCYLSDGECDKAKEIFYSKDGSLTSITKDARLLDLIRCYSAVKPETAVELVNKLTDVKNKDVANIIIESAETNKEALADYKLAVETIMGKEKLTSAEKKGVLEILSKIKNDKNEQIKQATKFWLAKINSERTCSFSDDIKGDLKFPTIQVSGSHSNEEIKKWYLYEKLNCNIDKNDNIGFALSVGSFLEDYQNEPGAGDLIKNLLEKYNINSKCFAVGDQESACNNFNQNIPNTFDSNLYRELKCHYVDVKWDTDDLCVPCINIKSCGDYQDISSCKANPCGIKNGCKNIGSGISAIADIQDKCAAK